MENDKFESKMNPRFLAEDVGGMECVEVRESDELITVEVCCGSKSNKKKKSVSKD